MLPQVFITKLYRADSSEESTQLMNKEIADKFNRLKEANPGKLVQLEELKVHTMPGFTGFSKTMPPLVQTSVIFYFHENLPLEDDEQ